jgi:hypothetical protein
LAPQAFDIGFAGFEQDIHGVERDEHVTFLIECLHEGSG